jgi:hypothetical protein
MIPVVVVALATCCDRCACGCDPDARVCAISPRRNPGFEFRILATSNGKPENELLRRPNQLLRSGRALLGDIVALGEREGVRVRSKAFVGPAKESVILRQATLGDHELIVLGTKAWSGKPLHFGHSAEALIARTMLDTYRKIVTCEGDG